MIAPFDTVTSARVSNEYGRKYLSILTPNDLVHDVIGVCETGLVLPLMHRPIVSNMHGEVWTKTALTRYKLRANAIKTSHKVQATSQGMAMT